MISYYIAIVCKKVDLMRRAWSQLYCIACLCKKVEPKRKRVESVSPWCTRAISNYFETIKGVRNCSKNRKHYL